MLKYYCRFATADLQFFLRLIYLICYNFAKIIYQPSA